MTAPPAKTDSQNRISTCSLRRRPRANTSMSTASAAAIDWMGEICTAIGLIAPPFNGASPHALLNHWRGVRKCWW